MKYISIKNICILVGIVAVILLILTGCKKLYDKGYTAGYDAGYTACAETMSVPIEVKQDTVQVGTTVSTCTETYVKPKKNASEPSVVIKTEEPKIIATVNGKKYDFKPQSEVLDTTVKTTGVINIKTNIPERKWVAGIGYGKDRKVHYLLKAPVSKNSAVGVWISGSGKSNFAGGLSVSF